MVAIRRIRNALLASSFLVLALGAPAAVRGAGTADPNRLFVVQRTLNANEVVYDAVRDGHGRFDRKDPVKAFWLMNAEHGQRQDLNAIEKLEAYGFKVRSDDRGGLQMTVAALKSRPIRLRSVGGRVEALVQIGGRTAVLRRVFVHTRPGHPTDVQSIELFGERPGTRAPVRERLTPAEAAARA